MEYAKNIMLYKLLYQQAKLSEACLLGMHSEPYLNQA